MWNWPIKSQAIVYKLGKEEAAQAQYDSLMASVLRNPQNGRDENNRSEHSKKKPITQKIQK